MVGRRNGWKWMVRTMLRRGPEVVVVWGGQVEGRRATAIAGRGRIFLVVGGRDAAFAEHQLCGGVAHGGRGAASSR